MTRTFPATVLEVLNSTSILCEFDLGFDVHVRKVLRIQGVDAPSQHAASDLEAAYGRQAAEYLAAVLTEVGASVLITLDLDLYQQRALVLGQVRLPSDEDLATLLIDNRYAVPYSGGPKRKFCVMQGELTEVCNAS